MENQIVTPAGGGGHPSDSRYRFLAMQLAVQLPRSEEDARHIYILLGKLIDNWVYIKEADGDYLDSA